MGWVEKPVNTPRDHPYAGCPVRLITAHRAARLSTASGRDRLKRKGVQQCDLAVDMEHMPDRCSQCSKFVSVKSWACRSCGQPVKPASTPSAEYTAATSEPEYIAAPSRPQPASTSSLETIAGRALCFLLLACPFVGTVGFIPLQFVMYPIVLLLTGSEAVATVAVIGTLLGLAWMLTLAATAPD